MPTNPFSIPTAVPGLYQNQGIQSRDNLNELDPEEALAAQNLNRKQQIANLLMQRGLQPIQGVQAGRFYVPPSWAQGLAQLASAGLGAGLTNKFGEDQAAIGQQAAQQRAQAVQDYIKNTSPQEVTTELEGPGAPQQKDLLGSQPFVSQLSPQEIAQGRWQQEVDQQGPGAFQEGPRPTTTTMQAPSEATKNAELIKVMTARDPSIRRFGELQFQAQQAEKEHALQRQTAEKEHALQRDFLHQQNVNKIDADLEKSRNHVDMMVALKVMTTEEGAKAKKEADERHAALMKDIEGSRRAGLSETNETRLKIAEIGANKGNAKQDALEAKVEAGRNTVSSLVATLGDAYDQLDAAGGITNPDKSTMANIGAGIASSGPGQMAGKLLGTQNQSLRNQIVQQRPLLLNAIKEATGMSAKQMDSNAELKMYLSAATDPNIDIKANRAALAKLEELYGLGGKTATAAPAAPAKVTSDADYEALAPGTTYLAPDGTTRTKKK